MRMLEGHTEQVMALAYAPDGRLLASAGWDGRLFLWDASTGRVARRIREPDNHVLSVAFSPDGKFLAAGLRNNVRRLLPSSGCGSLAWFPVRARADDPRDKISPGDTWFAYDSGEVRGVAFAPNGRQLFTLGRDAGLKSSLVLWDVHDRRSLLSIRPKTVRLRSLAFRHDGRAVAAISSANFDGIFVWDLRTGGDGRQWFSRRPRRLRLPNDAGESLAYSPDSRMLAAGFASGRLVWWWPEQKDEPVVHAAHDGVINSLVFSPDGRRLLSAGSDGLIHLWDTETRDRITTYDWRLGDIHCLAYAPDGLTAAAGGDGAILVWDIDG